MAGVVTELWRYPVKSVLGERREFVHVNARGVLGDRLYAIRDRDGKLGSGKNTRRFRRIDGLFGCHARYDGAVPIVTLPDGMEARGDDPSADSLVRRALGRDDVLLAREHEISHFDSAPLHVVTEESLSWLAGAVGDVKIDSRRARPNIVVSTGEAPGPVENTWVGWRAAIGDVVIEFVKLTERCVMVNNAQDDLTHSSEVLRTISARNELAFGIYATVIRGGTIRLGDEVRMISALRGQYRLGLCRSGGWIGRSQKSGVTSCRSHSRRARGPSSRPSAAANTSLHGDDYPSFCAPRAAGTPRSTSRSDHHSSHGSHILAAY